LVRARSVSEGRDSTPRLRFGLGQVSEAGGRNGGTYRMVYLSRIYTKSGDQGDTGLGDGSRVAKDHPRVAAYGSVDELNAVLGLLVSQHPQAAEVDLLRTIQNDLFDVGADLCLPQAVSEAPGAHLRVRAEQAERLEQAIDLL